MPDRNQPTPVAVGETSEAIVLARLVELGYAVSVPFGNAQRYDMIVDDGEHLVRAQVKTGRLRAGSVGFPVESNRTGPREQRGYLGEADDFLVYCPETNEVYRVPVAECGAYGRAYLRVDPFRGRSARPEVRWAREHVFEQDARSARGASLGACETVHPGTPPRIATKSSGRGRVRRYCRECQRTWAQQARDRNVG